MHKRRDLVIKKNLKDRQFWQYSWHEYMCHIFMIKKTSKISKIGGIWQSNNNEENTAYSSQLPANKTYNIWIHITKTDFKNIYQIDRPTADSLTMFALIL